MAKRKSSPKRPIPAGPPTAAGVLVDIRDVPAYRREHSLRIVAASWPLVPDAWANGKQRPAERWPTLIVEPIDPAKGRG